MLITPPHPRVHDAYENSSRVAHSQPPYLERSRRAYVARLIRAIGLNGIVKTLWYNFRILPLRQAVRLPLWVSRKTTLYLCRKGCIEIEESKPRPGMLKFGLSDLQFYYDSNSFVSIMGRLIIRGKNFHSFAPGLSMNIRPGAVLELGDSFSCANFLRIFVSDRVTVGDNNMWSFYNLVMDTDAHQILDGEGRICNPPKPIVFGDNCWMGAYSKVLKGAEIPSGSICGAGSTVTKPLHEENSIYIGNTLVKSNIHWRRDLQ